MYYSQTSSINFCVAVAVMLLLCIHIDLKTSVSAQILDGDDNENCAYWAGIGECAKNPNYMLRSCKASCAKAAAAARAEELPKSFYDIVETDLGGNELRFDQFAGKVVYVVNVASYCGYTESNYKMFKALEQFESEGLVIILAPCNAFGSQEPGDAVAIDAFAKDKGFTSNGSTRFILSKAEVNGEQTRVSFQYLKHHGGKPNIQWNFEGKFIVDREGKVHTPLNDMTVLKEIQALLRDPSKHKDL